jgi:hypothetical protein
MKRGTFIQHLLIIALAYKQAHSFGLLSTNRSLRLYELPKTSTHLLSSKEDEIAALEEKLRKLKEEAAMKENQVEAEIPTPRVTIEEPFDEMLTEKWKEKETESADGGGFIKNLVGIAILLIASIAVSQIPAGQEGYDKYTVAKPNTSIDLGDLNPPKGSLSGKLFKCLLLWKKDVDYRHDVSFFPFEESTLLKSDLLFIQAEAHTFC